MTDVSKRRGTAGCCAAVYSSFCFLIVSPTFLFSHPYYSLFNLKVYILVTGALSLCKVCSVFTRLKYSSRLGANLPSRATVIACETNSLWDKCLINNVCVWPLLLFLHPSLIMGEFFFSSPKISLFRSNSPILNNPQLPVSHCVWLMNVCLITRGSFWISLQLRRTCSQMGTRSWHTSTYYIRIMLYVWYTSCSCLCLSLIPQALHAIREHPVCIQIVCALGWWHREGWGQRRKGVSRGEERKCKCSTMILQLMTKGINVIREEKDVIKVAKRTKNRGMQAERGQGRTVLKRNEHRHRVEVWISCYDNRTSRWLSHRFKSEWQGGREKGERQSRRLS